MRRPALLAALAGLHIAGALLMWRSGVALPAPGRVVYADLLFVAAPPAAKNEPAVAVPPAAAVKARPASPAQARERSEPTQPVSAPSTDTAAPSTDVPVATPDAQSSPTLDLAAMRAAAGAQERQRVRSGLELVQEEQRVRGRDDSDGARAIRKAGRTDCTKAYAGGAFDPLKLIPLIYDTLTDTGCKW